MLATWLRGTFTWCLNRRSEYSDIQPVSQHLASLALRALARCLHHGYLLFSSNLNLSIPFSVFPVLTCIRTPSCFSNKPTIAWYGYPRWKYPLISSSTLAVASVVFCYRRRAHLWQYLASSGQFSPQEEQNIFKIERGKTWPPSHRDSAKTFPATMCAHNTIFYFCSNFFLLQQPFIFAATLFYFALTFSYMLHETI